jgi:hypothetical protein
VTLHVKYGDEPADRTTELRGIARWMREWAERTNAWPQDLIALGDFNIDRRDDPLLEAFTSTGPTVPPDLADVPRSVFAEPGEATTDKYYDQIAWFAEIDGAGGLSMDYRRGGFVNFLPYVYTHTDLTKEEICRLISDHYPLWAEFAI